MRQTRHSLSMIAAILLAGSAGLALGQSGGGAGGARVAE